MDCDPAEASQTKTTSVSVKIFQPFGRLLNIGTGSVDIDGCSDHLHWKN